jgi:hypothetical protein
MFRRDGALLDRRGSRSGARVASPTLAERILAAAPTATKRIIRLSPAPGTGLTEADCYTLVGAACSSWLDLGPDAVHASQGTAARRPQYSATAVNSLPGLTFDGGDILATASYDLTGADSVALFTVAVDATAAVSMVSERSPNAGSNDGGYYFTANETIVGSVRLSTRGAGVGNATSSTASLASPTLVTLLIDQTLVGVAQTEIRVDGVLTTTVARPSTSTTSGGFGTHAHHIGARSGPSLGYAGAIAAQVEISWPGAIPLAEVEAVDDLLLAVGWV